MKKRRWKKLSKNWALNRKNFNQNKKGQLPNLRVKKNRFFQMIERKRFIINKKKICRLEMSREERKLKKNNKKLK